MLRDVLLWHTSTCLSVFLVKKLPLSSNIFHSSNNNAGYPTHVNGSQQESNMLSGPQDRGSRPRPVQSVYPWSFQSNNGYTSMPQPITPSPSQPPVYNNGYTFRPHSANQWTPQPSYQPPSPRPTRWVDNQEPGDRNQEFDLVDFQSLPDTYKTAFMSVEELVRNRGSVVSLFIVFFRIIYFIISVYW